MDAVNHLNESHGRRRPTEDEIDDKYRHIDPDDVSENAIDYFRGDPETESEKSDERRDAS